LHRNASSSQNPVHTGCALRLACPRLESIICHVELQLQKFDTKDCEPVILRFLQERVTTSTILIEERYPRNRGKIQTINV